MQLVRLSLVSVLNHKPDAGQLFYRRLFEIAPELRPLFKSDIDAQSHKFIDMLRLILSLLNNPSGLSNTLTQLAHRHRNYGVRDDHFEKVHAALLWTFEDILGAGFTPELRSAWSSLYKMVASAMKRASPRSANG